jgi:hypothetical protein
VTKEDTGGNSGSHADASSQQAVSTKGFDPGRVPIGVFTKSDLHDARLQKCTRGYLLQSSGGVGMMSAMFAFDRIEDVAAFLVEYLSEQPQ